jgi:lysozyme family protein
MADFLKLAPFTKKWEGGFVNHPSDPGGATMAGVTLKTFRQFYGQNKTVEDLKKITDEQWAEVMRSYWNAIQGDKINSQSVANALGDWAVNSGKTAPSKAVQRLIGVVIDGTIGPVTLAAINRVNAQTLFSQIQKARIDFVEDIVRRKPEMKVFLKGWLNRINNLKFQQ